MYEDQEKSVYFDHIFLNNVLTEREWKVWSVT